MSKNAGYESKAKTALITGASAGIGRAFAEELARRGYDLVLTARREERLCALAQQLDRRLGARALVVPADLADPAAPNELFRAVNEADRRVDLLVNDAGYAVPGHLTSQPWKVHADFIQVLVTSVVHLCHLFLPGMVERGHGHIINVASLAAFVPGSAGHTLYTAAKSFVVKLSESLALELDGTGVHVCAVCPGFTYSEFHDVIGNRSQVAKLPKLMWMDADEVAHQSVDAVMRGDSVYVNGTVNKLIAGFVPRIPGALARHIMGRQSDRLRIRE